MSLNSILDKSYIDKGFYTHVSSGNMRGKYCIGRENMDNLYDRISKESHCLLEKPEEYIPFYMDFDIKHSIENYKEFIKDNKFYSYDDIKKIIPIVNQGIKMMIECNDDELYCSLLEKEIYKKNEKEISGGFHLHWTGIFMKRDDIKNILIPYIYPLILDKVGLKIDNVYNNCWLMYNGSKDSNLQSYKLTKNYDICNNEMTLIETFQDYKVFDTNENLISITESNVEYLLPRILSIIPHCRNIKETSKNELKENIKQKIVFIRNDITNEEVDENINKIRKILPLIRHDTDDIRKLWFSVLCNCSFLTNKNEEGFEIFDDWCQGFEKYDRYENEKTWNGDGYNGSMEILINMVHPNDKHLFEKKHIRLIPIIEKNELDDADDDILTILLNPLTDLRCAELFYKYNKNDIFYSKIDGYVLYNEKEKLWRMDCEKNELITVISLFFREHFEKNKTKIIEIQIKKKIDVEDEKEIIEIQKEKLQKKIDVGDNEKEIEKWNKEKEKLQKKIDKVDKQKDNNLNDFYKKRDGCESSTWSAGVLKHLDNIFKKNHNTDFILENFDNIDHLYPLGDNVLDFKTKEIRERRFEDFFTYTNDTEYIPIHLRKTDEIVKYLKEIWGTDDDKYVYNASQIMSYNLCGDNKMKKVVFHLGGGDNGKSVFINLNGEINKSQVVAPERAFIVKNNESVLQTELKSLVKVRMAVVNEPSEGKILNEDIIKQISGDDKNIQIRCRGDRGYNKVIIKCKLSIVLNQMLIIKDKKGMGNRVLVIDYPNTFEKSIVKINEIMSLKNHYFSYLVDILHEMYQNDFNIDYCNQIIGSTDREQLSQDSFKMFINEYIEFTDNEDDRVSALSFNHKYNEYCFYNGIEKISPVKVGKRLLKEYRYDESKKHPTNKGIVYKFMKMRKDEFENENENENRQPLFF